jgi:hypothetical protein
MERERASLNDRTSKGEFSLERQYLEEGDFIVETASRREISRRVMKALRLLMKGSKGVKVKPSTMRRANAPPQPVR